MSYKKPVRLQRSWTLLGGLFGVNQFFDLTSLEGEFGQKPAQILPKKDVLA
jgi:hypothetical protein